MTTTPETVKCKHCQSYVPAEDIWNGYCDKTPCVAQWSPEIAESRAQLEASRARLAALTAETDRLYGGSFANYIASPAYAASRRPKRNTKGVLWLAVVLIFIVITVIGMFTVKTTQVTRIKDYDPATGKVTTETCDAIDPNGFIRPDQCTTDR